MCKYNTKDEINAFCKWLGGHLIKSRSIIIKCFIGNFFDDLVSSPSCRISYVVFTPEGLQFDTVPTD